MQECSKPDRPNQLTAARKMAKLNKPRLKLSPVISRTKNYTLTPLHAYLICVKRIYQSKDMNFSRLEFKSENRFTVGVKTEILGQTVVFLQLQV